MWAASPWGPLIRNCAVYMEYGSSTSLSCSCYHMAYEGRDLISQVCILRDGSLCSLQWCQLNQVAQRWCSVCSHKVLQPVRGTVSCSTFMAQGPTRLFASGNSERGVKWVRRDKLFIWLRTQSQFQLNTSIVTFKVISCLSSTLLIVLKYFGVGYKEAERKKRPLV